MERVGSGTLPLPGHASGLYRLRAGLTTTSFLLAGLPLFGLLSIPISYLLLEGLRWSLAAVNPARATLFIVTMAVVGCGICGVRAAQQGRRWESMVWFMISFAMPVQNDDSTSAPDLREWLINQRFLIVLGLSVICSPALGGAPPTPGLRGRLSSTALLSDPRAWSGAQLSVPRTEPANWP